ncbi:sulfite exporter TauE/SafE family protein [candidate division KSB1 bacterium]|nr:sulfite exporter TauE/SafE family protein [candidate division KSB1 bacterium]
MKGIRPAFKLIILIASVFFCVDSIQAHPLDISYTTLTPQANGIYGETYIHPYELSLLAKTRGTEFYNLDQAQLEQLVIPYFEQYFKVFAGTEQLELFNVKIDSTETSQILSDGLYVTFMIPGLSGRPLYNFDITLFTSFFSTQTNKVLLLDRNGQVNENYREVFFTKNRTKWTLDLLKPDFSADYDDNIDSDRDGLTDHLEKLYGTNRESKDTDRDGYSDFVEFYMGWDPLDQRASKGQNLSALAQIEQWNDAFTSGKELKTDSKISTYYGQDGIIAPDTIKADTSKGSTPMMPRRVVRPQSQKGNSYLSDALPKIEDKLTGKWSAGGLLTVMGIVFVLGFIHAVSAGHGKGILISYLLDANHQFGHALRFIFIFTLTHLVDVIFLGIGALVIASSIDPETVTPILQRIGGIGLVIIALIQIGYGVRKLRKPLPEPCEQPGAFTKFLTFVKEFTTPSKKKRRDAVENNPGNSQSAKKGSAWLAGLLAGLAPCPFGWAIFMLLWKIGKIEFIFILIPVFGLGIFASLFAFSIFILLFRKGALHLAKGAEKYSILVSGILLLIFAIYFLMPGYTF